jgi:hypothetical protein
MDIHAGKRHYLKPVMATRKGRYWKLVVRFRPGVRARQGLMLGIRQPLDGPVLETLEDARNLCVHAMGSHYDRRLGMSDAKIVLVNSGAFNARASSL